MSELANRPSEVAALLSRHDIWRGRQQTPPAGTHPPCPSGWSALDEILGGGWPRQGLVELYSGSATRAAPRPIDHLGTDPLQRYQGWFQDSLGFGALEVLLPLLRKQAAERGVALLNPPARLCAERWQAEGVALDRLLLIAPNNLRELGWATEEVLQSGVYPLVVAWLPPLGFALRRRLKLAAETSGGCLVTPYPLGAEMAAGTPTAPSSPAWAQLIVHRHAQTLSVRRIKPFHPREVHLELDAGGAHATSLDETGITPLTLVGAR